MMQLKQQQYCNRYCIKTVFRRETSLSEERRVQILSSGTASQLDRVAIELLETERSYVNDLNDVIQVIKHLLLF